MHRIVPVVWSLELPKLSAILPSVLPHAFCEIDGRVFEINETIVLARIEFVILHIPVLKAMKRKRCKNWIGYVNYPVAYLCSSAILDSKSKNITHEEKKITAFDIRV